MGRDPRLDNLVPFKPGQSGNPKGSSKKQRRALRMKEALTAVMESAVPDVILEQLDDRLREMLPDDMTFAELSAIRVALIAGGNGSPGEILAAANLLVANESKTKEVETAVKAPPKLPSTEERRSSVAAQLGVTDETPDVIH